MDIWVVPQLGQFSRHDFCHKFYVYYNEWPWSRSKWRSKLSPENLLEQSSLIDQLPLWSGLLGSKWFLSMNSFNVIHSLVIIILLIALTLRQYDGIVISYWRIKQQYHSWYSSNALVGALVDPLFDAVFSLFIRENSSELFKMKNPLKLWRWTWRICVFMSSLSLSLSDEPVLTGFKSLKSFEAKCRLQNLSTRVEATRQGRGLAWSEPHKSLVFCINIK